MIIIKNILLSHLLGVWPSSRHSSQPKLFTPGPLCTSERVKQSMNYDYGSRDPQFLKIVSEVRNSLLELCHVKKGEYEAVIVQGSGTYAVEACIGCSVPKGKHKVLVIVNGAYGKRCVKIAQVLNLNHIVLSFRDSEVVDAERVKQILKENPDITHATIQHSETTTGSIFPRSYFINIF